MIATPIFRGAYAEKVSAMNGGVHESYIEPALRNGERMGCGADGMLTVTSIGTVPTEPHGYIHPPETVKLYDARADNLTMQQLHETRCHLHNLSKQMIQDQERARGGARLLARERARNATLEEQLITLRGLCEEQREHLGRLEATMLASGASSSPVFGSPSSPPLADTDAAVTALTEDTAAGGGSLEKAGQPWVSLAALSLTPETEEQLRFYGMLRGLKHGWAVDTTTEAVKMSLDKMPLGPRVTCGNPPSQSAVACDI